MVFRSELTRVMFTIRSSKSETVALESRTTGSVPIESLWRVISVGATEATEITSENVITMIP